jgi:hypothetical protein
MRAWLAEHACELVLFAIFALLAGGAWAMAGVGPLFVWLALASIAAPIIGRAIDCDDAFDCDLDDISPTAGVDEHRDHYQ